MTNNVRYINRELIMKNSPCLSCKSYCEEIESSLRNFVGSQEFSYIVGLKDVHDRITRERKSFVSLFPELRHICDTCGTPPIFFDEDFLDSLNDYEEIINLIDSGHFSDKDYDGLLEKSGYDLMSLSVMEDRGAVRDERESPIILLFNN